MRRNNDNRLRLSRTLPNLPMVEEDVESVDSADGGGVFFAPPAPPPPSPNLTSREVEQFGISVPRDLNQGSARSSMSSGTTFVADEVSPHRNDAIDHHNVEQYRHLIAHLEMSSLDPTTASFEPASSHFGPDSVFGAANQLRYSQNANTNQMAFAENGNGTLNGMQQRQFQQQPQSMHTFPLQTPVADIQQQGQALMLTFPQEGSTNQPQPLYQAFSSKNQNHQAGPNMLSQLFAVQTPQQGGGEGSMGRFTPATYRATPQQTTSTSSSTFSPDTSLTGYPPSTEPRSFAPRTSGLNPSVPPPRFALQIPAPAQHALVHVPQQPSATIQRRAQRSNSVDGHTFPANLATQVNSGHNVLSFDPFRTIELPRTIEPVETISHALVEQTHTVPEQIRTLRSKKLNELTAGPKKIPTIEMALHPEYFPFMEGPRNAKPSPNYGVVKIKNIPFSSRRAEIIAFLGRNSRVLNDGQEPVHIIMERVTSKTNDCYVEFMSTSDAVHAVERHNRAVSNGRQNRLGDRPVELELSSQAALMKDLFPHAQGVRWDGSHPVILEDHPTEPWSCFKGFITEEEMICLVKHVEVPQRSPFSRDCPQRPYECMISTLRKLPWYMVEHITIRQRHAIFRAVVALITRLQIDMRLRKFEQHLNEQLYKRLWTSALLCDGLAVTMKDGIAYLVGLDEYVTRTEFHMPRYGNMWVHQYTMAPKPDAPEDVVEWYIAIIREETERRLGMSLPNIQATIRQETEGTCTYWGYLFKELNLPYGAAFDNMTLAEMANREFEAVTDILRRAFGTADAQQ